METQNTATQNFLLIFSFAMFFLGLYLGKTMWYTETNDRVAQIVSCEGYEEDFLKEMGFKDRNSCVDLNVSLHKQYTDDCINLIRSSSDMDYNLKLLDLCVYHSFEKQAVSLSSEYVIYKRNKRDTAK